MTTDVAGFIACGCVADRGMSSRSGDLDATQTADPVTSSERCRA
jgi:hypothetical protein